MGEFLRDEKQKEALSEIKKSCFDTQVGGNHYQKMVIQPIDFITKNNLDFCEGNVIKYVCRYKEKNGIEDLLKAKHYLEVLIENLKD
ncbi:hypothetical protein CFT12S00416_05620 [Campylobacter fetus subsp. testudinum]|uniref:DUF3310 domain-containing protein n=1 Tax=Campylobacter fetus TaxID=196 RepID=UPI000818B765|nr:DUF3310 domain-containing protein [Campylobacter fetus]OCR88902.1 hypothetical protein CFT12S00416_05620 [Campylobacter fetus subsp. testudinum]